MNARLSACRPSTSSRLVENRSMTDAAGARATSTGSSVVSLTNSATWGFQKRMVAYQLPNTVVERSSREAVGCLTRSRNLRVPWTTNTDQNLAFPGRSPREHQPAFGVTMCCGRCWRWTARRPRRRGANPLCPTSSFVRDSCALAPWLAVPRARRTAAHHTAHAGCDRNTAPLTPEISRPAAHRRFHWYEGSTRGGRHGAPRAEGPGRRARRSGTHCADGLRRLDRARPRRPLGGGRQRSSRADRGVPGRPARPTDPRLRRAGATVPGIYPSRPAGSTGRAVPAENRGPRSASWPGRPRRGGVHRHDDDGHAVPDTRPQRGCPAPLGPGGRRQRVRPTAQPARPDPPRGERAQRHAGSRRVRADPAEPGSTPDRADQFRSARRGDRDRHGRRPVRARRGRGPGRTGEGRHRRGDRRRQPAAGALGPPVITAAALDRDRRRRLRGHRAGPLARRHHLASPRFTGHGLNSVTHPLRTDRTHHPDLGTAGTELSGPTTWKTLRVPPDAPQSTGGQCRLALTAALLPAVGGSRPGLVWRWCPSMWLTAGVHDCRSSAPPARRGTETRTETSSTDAAVAARTDARDCPRRCRYR